MSCAPRNLRWRFAAAVPLALLGGLALAQAPQRDAADATAGATLDFSLLGGASQSDNIRRTATDEESGTIGIAGVELSYQQNSRRIDADVDVNARYESYPDDVFEDDVVGGVDASLTLGVMPEKFLWFFQENFGQLTTDPFAADTPENRENINYFTTGPDLILNLGREMSLRVAGRFSDVQYEVSETDGQRYAGMLSLARELSSASRVSLNVESSKFEFDDQTLNSDYTRDQAYLRYEIDGARTQLTADAGYTTLDIDDESPDGTLARIALTRQMSTASTLSFSIGRQFSDSGDMFRDGQDLSGSNPETSPVVGVGEPFESRYGSLNYDFDRNRTAFGLGVRQETERYETTTTLDHELTTWSTYIRRTLSPVIEVSIFGQFYQQDFENVEYEDDDLRYGAYLSWALGRRVSLRFQYDCLTFDSTVPENEYTENRLSLFVSWSPLR